MVEVYLPKGTLPMTTLSTESGLGKLTDQRSTSVTAGFSRDLTDGQHPFRTTVQKLWDDSIPCKYQPTMVSTMVSQWCRMISHGFSLVSPMVSHGFPWFPDYFVRCM